MTAMQKLQSTGESIPVFMDIKVLLRMAGFSQNGRNRIIHLSGEEINALCKSSPKDDEQWHSSPIEIFDKKIQDLRDNEFKIMRIFSKYEVFDLPYDVQEKDKIENLFDDIIALCESRKRRNAAMKGFLDAYQNANLDKLDDEL